jgi:hypothetical protein
MEMSGETYSGGEIYYRHSGRIGPLGLVFMPVLGLGASAVLGGIYGFAIFYMPSVYLSAILTILFGAGVGVPVGWGAKIGKVRNTAVAAAFGAIAGALAVYFAWVSWIAAVTGGSTSLEPGVLWQAAQKIAAKGAWSMLGVTPTGLGLYAVWALEALVIVSVSTLMAASAVFQLPFCERCRRWAKAHARLPRLAAAADASDLRLQLESGNTDALKELGKAAPQADQFTELELHSCAKCKNLHVLTAKTVTVARDRKGKESRSQKTVIEGRLLDASRAADVMAL